MQKWDLATLLPEHVTGSDVEQLEWAGVDDNRPANLFLEHEPCVAGAALGRVKEVVALEPSITASIQRAAEAGSAHVRNLEFRVKSPSSTARKIRLDAQKSGIAPQEASQQITDLIRYTVTVANTDEMPDAGRQVHDALATEGWRTHSLVHSFVDGNPYKGLHLKMRHPEGEVVEVQIHTEAGHKVKQEAHLEYEAFRNPALSLEERSAARQRSVDLYRQVPKPSGIDDLTLGGVSVRAQTYPNPFPEGDVR